MYIITHRLKTSTDFMDRYLPEGPAGGFFLEEKLGMPEGSRLCLELVLGWLDETYYPYATVERTQLTWDNCGRLEKGCIVRLDADEAPLRDQLLDKVRLSAERLRQRGGDRQSLNLRVHCFDEKRRAREGQVLDLSPSGAYVRTRRPLPTGSDVHLRFEDRAARVMRHVRGRVVRLDFTRGVAGMGVAFDFLDRRERRAVARLCRHLAKKTPPPLPANL